MGLSFRLRRLGARLFLFVFSVVECEVRPGLKKCLLSFKFQRTLASARTLISVSILSYLKIALIPAC
jgi:hypothetical protein